MKKLTVLLLIFQLFAGCTCSEPNTTGMPSEPSIVLMTWNVHNLFDGEDNGFEYDEFKQSASWSVEKYLGRINSLSAAVSAIDPAPDIIIMQEIESLVILKDMAHSLSGGYSHSHFANNPGAALGLGILSRIPLGDSRVHSITINGETTPRPVLETRVDTENGAFVIFACHWKSKLGGDNATENVRRSSARVILRRMRELWEDEPELGVIVAGDLNENHDEFYKQGGKYLCALMPDDLFCSQMTGGIQKDFIVIAKNNPPSPVHFPEDSIVLYSPWMSDLEAQAQPGSYFYSYNWETIDHFLISGQFFNDTGWKYEKAFVANFPPFVNNSGIPFSYNVKTGMGLSDHLPLLIKLTCN